MSFSIKTIGVELVLFIANRIVARIPSHYLRRLFYKKIMKFDIGEKCFIFMDAHFYDVRGKFKMKGYSVINQRCILDNRGGIEIGRNVSISSDVCILTADHDIYDPVFEGRFQSVVIEDFAFVGTRATILPGVTVGYGAAVAAGALVTKNVAAFDVVAGCPAKIIGKRPQNFDYIIDYCRMFQ